MPNRPPVRRPKQLAHSPRPTNKEKYHERNRLRGRRWRTVRKLQLQAEPYCRSCSEHGRVVAACEVDHIEPSRGNPTLHWDWGNLQSLCEACHLAKSRQESQKGGRTGKGPNNEDQTGT